MWQCNASKTDTKQKSQICCGAYQSTRRLCESVQGTSFVCRTYSIRRVFLLCVTHCDSSHRCLQNVLLNRVCAGLPVLLTLLHPLRLTESRYIRLYACYKPVIVSFRHRNGAHAHTLPSASLPTIGLEIDLIVRGLFWQSGQKLSKLRLLLYLLLGRNLSESPQYFTWISSVQPHSAPFLLFNWMSSRLSSPLSAHNGTHIGTAGNLVFRWVAVKENAC